MLGIFSYYFHGIIIYRTFNRLCEKLIRKALFCLVSLIFISSMLFQYVVIFESIEICLLEFNVTISME